MDRHPAQPLDEGGVPDPRVVVADGVRREVGKAVEEVAPGAGAAHPRAATLLEIEDEIESVRDEVPAEDAVDFGGTRIPGDGGRNGTRGHPGSVPSAKVHRVPRRTP